MRRLNKGESFDAVWLSNSIWQYMIDSSKVHITDSKSTSINPIIFGIKKSKAEELGFVGKDVYMKDILGAITSGKLTFSMANPTTTNSGASAYLGLVSTLAGNPEVLTSKMLESEALSNSLEAFFKGLERSSGDEDFLEELFLNGDYDAVIAYESSIININKELEKNKKEILYAIYPVDGVSISDSPIAYIDNKDDEKKEQFLTLQDYLLSDKGKDLLASLGRRTWYGGVTDKADKKVFNPSWGIDTTKYISPTKYPSTAVIKQALALYQTSFKKAVHVVFVLDYSGSMSGEGIESLREAMDYILTDKAAEEYIQFSEKDKVDVVPFASKVIDVWSSENPTDNSEVLDQINHTNPYGTTALYPATAKALRILQNSDDNYNKSIILMTDGFGNVGYYDELEAAYKEVGGDIPIYSIMFGQASEDQLKEIAKLSNAKVFDGKTDLIEAFKEVRGYN
jgi:Ca-activated chloride channel family protein